MSDIAEEFQPDDEATQQRDDLRILKAHAAQLSERFDTVEIICTRDNGKGTILAANGIGNWYARYGSVRGWLKNEDGMIFAPRDE